ncbi:expressed unknown protein [Seminavis robusta]|uniref:Fatty acid hydroxylase domain-containing protein n=1 Tax=Seminavis robusta TaxID=568900 RepID=A0A9N8DVG1_9STRA|nr:expressed unknown protein [Seminavis robusta]|eukprot:Sro275_g105750.1 n/a (294) ;mRNA; f:50062-50943
MSKFAGSLLLFIVTGGADAFHFNALKPRIVVPAEGSATSKMRPLFAHVLCDEIAAVGSNDKDDLWSQLEQVTENHLKEKKRVFFNLKELQHDHEPLAHQLQAETQVAFQVPETMEEALESLIATPSMQFTLVALAVTLGVRLVLGPLGVADLIAMVATKVFWELQEWIVHAHFFHGKERKAMWPFENHDKHHNLPYYHVSVETLPMVVGWYSAVASAALAAVSIGAPADLAMTSLGSYTTCGLMYMVLHFLTHTKLPMKGWLQEARANHIKHHLEPGTNLNMGPNTFDRIMQT